MSLEVKHLTHTYSAGSAFQATAVHDVSLTIEDGEFVCIVGHTGSGKSTLAVIQPGADPRTVRHAFIITSF